MLATALTPTLLDTLCLDPFLQLSLFNSESSLVPQYSNEDHRFAILVAETTYDAVTFGSRKASPSGLETTGSKLNDQSCNVLAQENEVKIVQECSDIENHFDNSAILINVTRCGCYTIEGHNVSIKNMIGCIERGQ